jgi:uncharacterized protein (TIGR02118 family)
MRIHRTALFVSPFVTPFLLLRHTFRQYRQETRMIRVTKYYRWQSSGSFDRDYYNKQHMKLTREQLIPYGLERLESDHRVSSRAPTEGEIIAACHAYFRSFEEARAAMTAAGPTLMRDSARYTNLMPEIRFSAVTAHF